MSSMSDKLRLGLNEGIRFARGVGERMDKRGVMYQIPYPRGIVKAE